MKRIAIPIYEDRISNRLDGCETLLLVTIEADEIKKREVIRLRQTDSLAKLSRMLDLAIDMLICNGITDFYLRRFLDNDIQVFPWISGSVDEVLAQYLSGKLPASTDASIDAR